MNNIKMKGLLKGLRYISQIFDPNEKEPEMQIGYPTDVVHVTHIGCDDGLTTPSWIGEFKQATPRSRDVAPERKMDATTSPKTIVLPTPHDITSSSDASMGSPPLREMQLEKPRRNRSARDEPVAKLPDLPVPKSSRRHGSTSAIMAEPTSTDEGSGRGSGRGRRPSRKKEQDYMTEPTQVELRAVPKVMRKKLNKEGTWEG